MTAALVAALLALNPTPPPPDNHDPFRGSQEPVTPRLNHSSRGMTLDVLHGLPRTRPTWPQQPQVWAYQPYVVYPTYSYGLGGYRPPGVGGNSRVGIWLWVP